MESSLRPFPPYAIVVEHEPLIRMDAVDILEDVGFQVLEAHTGDGAVELLRQHHHGTVLLLTAWKLRGQHDGFALARIVTSNYPHIIIAVASGHAKLDLRDMPGVACLIGKPFSARIVHDHLRRIMPDEQKPMPLKNETLPPRSSG